MLTRLEIVAAYSDEVNAIKKELAAECLKLKDYVAQIKVNFPAGLPQEVAQVFNVAHQLAAQLDPPVAEPAPAQAAAASKKEEP